MLIFFSEVSWRSLAGKPEVVCFAVIGSWWVNVHSCIHSSALLQDLMCRRTKSKDTTKEETCHWHFTASNKTSIKWYWTVVAGFFGHFRAQCYLQQTMSHTDKFAYFVPQKTGWCRAGPQSQLRGHADSWTLPAGGKASGWHPGLEPGHFLLWLWGRPGGRERGGEGRQQWVMGTGTDTGKRVFGAFFCICRQSSNHWVFYF